MSTAAYFISLLLFFHLVLLLMICCLLITKGKFWLLLKWSQRSFSFSLPTIIIKKVQQALQQAVSGSNNMIIIVGILKMVFSHRSKAAMLELALHQKDDHFADDKRKTSCFTATIQAFVFFLSLSPSIRGIIHGFIRNILLLLLFFFC